MDQADSWRVVSKAPDRIAFSGIAALGTKLYIMGGCQNADEIPNRRSDEQQLWIYDTASSTWQVGPQMLKARQECGAVTIGERVYAFGWDLSCESIGAGDTSWRFEAACPIVLGGAGAGMGGRFACTAIGTTAYFAGPFGLLSFEPSDGWKRLPASPTPGECPLVAAHKGEIYVMSGFFYDPEPGQMCRIEKAVHSFNPESQTWTERPSLPSHQSWGAAISVDGRLLAIGGAHWCREARTFCFDCRVFALDI
eukprot:gnl/TRDRNA2_/TRDRNA2_141420_c0_seq1.p1 gnl/TRDRNA2_/TRDRNA2_141420_c0~~gnl/TRDRNA2_/TRDRNA2_141420_c0_seq1.p1  ORF type:complete len:292 (-),score=23.99 gnl/TRDRNA2_/TRDRNA2_141420_c0_seq1:162-917(-)